MEASVMATPEMVWVERARHGDTVAFETLLRRYERQIYGYIYHMMGGNAADADDLTQETFIKAYRALPRTTDGLHLSAWLHRIAANSCRDEWRRQRRNRTEPWDATVHEPLLAHRAEESPEALVLRRESDARVQAVLDRMRPRNAHALALREYKGLSCEEIGVIMGISQKAVKSTLFRARENSVIWQRVSGDGTTSSLSSAKDGDENYARHDAECAKHDARVDLLMASKEEPDENDGDERIGRADRCDNDDGQE